LIGIGFAVAGMVTPLLAAILMPISSIFAVVFVSLRTYQVSQYYLKD
jgi:cation transport ATPase